MFPVPSSQFHRKGEARGRLIALLLAVVCLVQIPMVLLAYDEGPSGPPPWSNDPAKGTSSSPLIFKFVFIEFPNTAPGENLVGPGVYDVLDGYVGLMSAQSNGNLNIEYSIVSDPRDSTQTKMWMAAEESGVYGDIATTPIDLEHCWGPGYFRHVGGLQGEVLQSIQTAYDDLYGQGNWTSPLAGSDMVIFVYKPAMPSGNPIGDGIGGTSWNYILSDCPDLSYVLNGTPVRSNGGLYGFNLNWWSLAFKNAISLELVHELGHNLRWNHPKESEVGTLAEVNCHFGSYDVMRAVAPLNMRYGFISHWSRYRQGWCSVTEFTEGTESFELKDWRLNGDVVKVPISSESIDYVFPGIDFTSHFKEYFLLAYHLGGYPYYQASDSGLFIWHIIDVVTTDNLLGITGSPSLLVQDLEIATGLFDSPEQNIGPNPENGIDLLDNWIGRAGYDSYLGASTDLFNASDVAEFSYKTNPSAQGYSWAAPLSRTNKFTLSQDQDNAISIRITDSTSDGIILDISFAPKQAVALTNSSGLLMFDTPVNITWDTTETVANSDGIIDTIDLFLLKGDGTEVPIVQGLDAVSAVDPADSTVGLFTWAPGPADATSNARIRAVFHNILDADHVGVDETDGTFTIIGPSITYSAPADPVGETGLSYQGTPYSSVAWNFNEDPYKDLFISISDDDSKLYQGDNISSAGIPHFLAMQNQSFTNGTPQPGLRGTAVGDVDNSNSWTDLFVAHPTDSRLYHWEDNSIVNTALSVGVDNYNDVVTGAWGDLDGDGNLDLFLARAEAYTEDPPNYGAAKISPASLVLTNVRDDSTGVHTLEPTPGSGLPDDLYSTNASWADYDQDGDQDLFVGVLLPQGGVASRLFRNDAGTLVDQTALLLGTTAVGAVVGCAWQDMNNDRLLDLVLARHGEQSLIYYQTTAGGFDDGAGGVGAFAFGPQYGFSGLAVFDYNNDGRLDFLGLPNSSTRPPELYENVLAVPRPEFLELPPSVGLSDVGYVHGAVAADFGGPGQALDGITDLYLGRPSASGKFYFKGAAYDPVDPDVHYTMVRLNGAPGVVNKTGIGATVEVQAGLHTQIQQVDGGSLRGGQADTDLMFGLGAETGPVTATITWPDGFVQSDVPLLPDQVNVITNAPVTVQDNTVTGSYTVKASGLVDWVFTWGVDGPSDPAVDAVIFDRAGTPQQCRPGYTIITDATPGVSLSYTAKPGGGYQHIMTWTDRDCVPKCTVPFQVESGFAGQTDINNTATKLTMRICISS